jgi:hypothetical protein
VAVSLLADTNVVDRDTPPSETTAPGVKPVPLTVSVKGPAGNDDGLTELIAGSGTTVTAADPLAVGTDTLVARTVTTPGFGTDDGRRYRPAVSIVPTLPVASGDVVDAPRHAALSRR